MPDATTETCGRSRPEGALLTAGNLADRARCANSRRTGAWLLPLLGLLAGCAAAEPPVGGQEAGVRPNGYPDLRSVPDAPIVEDEADRRAIGDALLVDLAQQAHAGDELRFRVGLVGSPPPALPAPPTVPAPESPEPVAQPPSDAVVARYLRQQIREEQDADDLSGLLDRLATEPIDIEAAAAAPRPPPRKRDNDVEEVFVSSREQPSLLDLALDGIGFAPTPLDPPLDPPPDQVPGP